ncbi:MAG: YrdB family protein [Flavihumibacter sp.]
MLKQVNQVIVFFLELLMLYAVGHFGYFRAGGGWPSVLLAVVLLGLVIAAWAYWAAPKSAHRLHSPWQQLLRINLFVLAAYLLYTSGQTTPALVLGAGGLLTQMISLFVEKD